MNRSQLVEAVTESTQMTRRTVGDVVGQLFDTIITEVRSGRKVTVVGFGDIRPRPAGPPAWVGIPVPGQWYRYRRRRVSGSPPVRRSSRR